MDDRMVMSAGVAVRGRDRRNANTKGSADYISDGSLIEVGVNQCMLLVDGGRIVDFTTEPGYYKVDNQATPSAFSGSFSQALEESFDRLRFGGVPSRSQKAYFINLQEIKGIAFGTPTPINYFDSFYNAELYLRTNGYFSIRITDPIRFYAEAIPHDRDKVTIEDIQKLYVAEILPSRPQSTGCRWTASASLMSPPKRWNWQNIWARCWTKAGRKSGECPSSRWASILSPTMNSPKS